MKKILSILLAVVMIAGLVPCMLLGASAEAYGNLTAIGEGKNGRVYHYYESFDTETTVQGAQSVIDVLGWQLPASDTMVSNHNANVIATEKGLDGVPMYEIKGGRLYLRNHGTADEVMMICSTEELASVVKGPYTVEYTLTYLPTSYNTDNGYFSLRFNANETMDRYGEALIRISGYGNNRTNAGALDAGDVSGTLSAENSMTAYRVDNLRNLSLYERLYGNVDVVPGTANLHDLRGSQVMAGKELHVRLSFDGVNGPRVYVNDILVSDPRNIANESTASKANGYFADLLAEGGYGLGFCLNPGIECVIDEIVLYNGISEAAELGDLYITEIATLPGNSLAPYVEIYNGGNAAVDLANYVLGYTTLKADGSEVTDSVALGDYIGRQLAVGDTGVIDNLSADAALLQAGETVVIFLVDTSADVAALVNTVGLNNLAGFRAEYGLGTDKVLALPCGEVVCTETNGVISNGLTVAPTECRTWFVGDLKNEKGANVNWKSFDSKQVKSSAYTDSAVVLVPSIAFGYNLGIADTSFMTGNDLDPIRYHFGRDGDVMPGYAAHFVYGADASASAATGLMISRTTTKIKNEMNVGELLEIQSAYFDRITDYRAGRYEIAGRLSITEFIPRTNHNDAFESFELTNLSAVDVNLYDYGIVSSGNALYGSVNAWSRATQLAAAPAEGITNPTNAEGAYVLEPGQSAVVWNMTAEGYTVADFRAYHGLADDVDVIVAVSLDAAKNVVAANAGTVSYGVAEKADVTPFLNGTATTVAKAVSDVTVPLHSLYYEIDGAYKYTWDMLTAANPTIAGTMAAEELAGCLMNGVRVGEGKSLAGYYEQVEITVPKLTLADGSILTDYTYTTYRPCLGGAVADGATVYYRPNNTESFFAYGTMQNIYIPADYAVSFTYGATVMASKANGAITSSLEVTAYDYNMGGRGYASALPYLISSANAFVTTEVIGGASDSATLGVIAKEQGLTVAMVSDVYFDVTYLDENGDFHSQIVFNGEGCRDVYVVLDDTYETWLVNNEFYNAGEIVVISADTVIAPGTAALAAGAASLRLLSSEAGSGLRFTTGVSKELYDNLVATYGAENVSLKTAIAPTAYVNEAGAATVEALDALDHSTNYLLVEATEFIDESYNAYYFAGSVSNVKDADRDFTGIGFIEVNANGETARYYGATASNASLNAVAATALADVSTSCSTTYCNEIAAGVYSPYTADQRKMLTKLG